MKSIPLIKKQSLPQGSQFGGWNQFRCVKFQD